MTTNIDIRDMAVELRANPGAIQRAVLNLVDGGVSGTLRVVDPSNPFVMLTESASAIGSAVMLSNEVNVRKQYGSLAQTEEELYLHMSDVDYVDRFATPSRTEFVFLLGKEELYQKAVATGVGGVRKLTIPRNTEITISEYKFTMQYPIDFRIMSHGGLQVVYDTTRLSPLQSLESNIVPWRIIELNNVEYVEVTVPMYQFQVKTSFEKLSGSSGFTQTIDYTDQFYFCRVYVSDTNGDWQEIRTTHTDQVYDPLVPTAVLTVFDSTIKVHLPIIYFTTGLIDSELRIDLYTTKGPLDLLLSTFDSRDFLARWIDLEGDDELFAAPLSTYSSMTLYSQAAVQGGKSALTFDELRKRVISNSFGAPDVPITNNQLSTKLEDLGYTVVKNIDNITNRIFLATRPIPAPTDGSTAVGAGTAVISIQATMEELGDYPTVYTNGDRLTISPSTVYKRENGVISVAGDTEVNAIIAMPRDAAANAVNASDYLYSPFHYVLDALGTSFSTRAYYLDEPVVEAKSFIHENDSAVMSVSTRYQTLERIPNGYRLSLLTRSGDSFKALNDSQVNVQLSYIPKRESDRAYIQGSLVGIDPNLNERLYQFDIITHYDINDADEIVLDSFKMYDLLNERNLPTELLTTFDITYVITNYNIPSMTTSSIDDIVGQFLLPTNITNFVGVTREKLTLRFGYPLTALWRKSRTVVSNAQYAKHTDTIPLLYTETVYQRDSLGNVELHMDAGEPKVTILHEVGDPVLDVNGDPVMKYNAGDIVYDNAGNPVLLEPRKLIREFDTMLVDGKYYFATAASSVTYKETISMIIVNWLRDDILPISNRLLEETELFFQPQTTVGTIDVIAEGAVDMSISAEQQLTVLLYVTPQIYESPELRVAMSKSVVSNISTLLGNPTVSLTTITSTLHAILGEEVLSIVLTGLGGDRALNAITLKDTSQRLVIKKRLVVDPSNELLIENDINVNFTPHLRLS